VIFSLVLPGLLLSVFGGRVYSILYGLNKRSKREADFVSWFFKDKHAELEMPEHMACVDCQMAEITAIT
jgi:hypothetical protein